MNNQKIIIIINPPAKSGTALKCLHQSKFQWPGVVSLGFFVTAGIQQGYAIKNRK